MKTAPCPLCGDRARVLTESRTLNLRVTECEFCGQLRRAITTAVERRQAARERARVDRERTRYEDWAVRYGSIPRTRTGLALRPPPDVRLAWRAVRKARRADALIRRGQVWLEALTEYARDDRYTDRWSITYKMRDGRCEQSKHKGGRGGVPTLKLVRDLPGAHGDFRSCILRGLYEIRLRDDRKWTMADESLSFLENLRATLVHEALHMLDADSQAPDRGHDRLWRSRLERMNRLFPAGQL